MRLPGVITWIAVSALATGSVVAANGVWSHQPSHPSSQQARQPASVGYLTGHYGISVSQAWQRLRLGQDATAVAAAIAALTPADYAGSWLDERHGWLDIATTDVTAARRAAAHSAHRTELRFVSVPHSARTLDEVAARVRAATGATTTIDAAADTVDAATTPARLAALPRSDRRLVTADDPARGIPTICTPTACGPPLRAGIGLILTKANKKVKGYCTSSFNFTDHSGTLFNSTAGHCFTTQPKAVYTTNNNVIIGDRTGSGAVIVEQGAALDFALVPVSAPGYWAPPGKRLDGDYFICSEPSPSYCATQYNRRRFAIRGMMNYANMQIGHVVCMSGAGPLPPPVPVPGTRCGEITALAGGSIQTNICAKNGDSGSPLFDQIGGIAYGIQSRLAPGQNAYGACAPANQTRTLYTPVSSVLTAANAAQPSRQYSLITTP